MRLENIVWDARDPRRLGRFWAGALGAEPLTDEPDAVEARVRLHDDLFLDLCFQHVASPSTAPARLHLDFAGGAHQTDVVLRLLDLGAEHADVGADGVPWVVLTDPEGGVFRVMGDHGAERPIAALSLDCADPVRDAAFWACATGWVPWPVGSATVLRHPSGAGPLLELRPEPAATRGKSRLHLDVRPAAGDVDAVQRLQALGAVPLSGPADHPWRVCVDPSGNEFCVLPPGR